MAATLAPVQYRISKSHGRFMMAVALLFDLLPILLIVLAVSVLFQAMGGIDGQDLANIAECAEYNTGTMSGTEFMATRGVPGRDTGASLAGDIACVKAYVPAARAVAAGVGGGFTAGPMLYAIGSILSILLAFILFVFWFAMKHVNVLKPTAKNLAVNGLTLLVESILIVNILVPSITLTTRHHVRTSQKEDRKKHDKQQKKLMAQRARQQDQYYAQQGRLIA